jgi:hypothetical protein
VVLDELILTVTGASLEGGLNCNFTVDILLASGTAGGDYTTATDPVTATILATSVTGPGASDSITIVDGPALTLELPLTAAAPGDQVSATFTLSRDSLAPEVIDIGFTLNLEDALAGLTADPLPLGEVCGTGSALALVINGGEEISFSGGRLDIDTSCTFDVVLNVPAAAESGSYDLTTSAVTSTVSGVSVSGSPVSASLDVTNLAAIMSFIDDPVAPGDSLVLRFRFENTSQTQARLTDNRHKFSDIYWRKSFGAIKLHL